jgi:hypothetical protein
MAWGRATIAVTQPLRYALAVLAAGEDEVARSVPVAPRCRCRVEMATRPSANATTSDKDVIGRFSAFTIFISS